MISLDAGFKVFSVSRRTTMTPEIIRYTPEIRGMFRAHQENNIAAPRGELTIPSTVRVCYPLPRQCRWQRRRVAAVTARP